MTLIIYRRRLFTSIKKIFNINSLKFGTEEKPPWKVMFFGADEFSVYSLKALHSECNGLIQKLTVVTTIKKDSANAVCKYAKQCDLPTLNWPIKIEKNEFDLGLVVSFGHLIPENVINSFKLGMLNVHASLLPRWRGAAPIIYALANGDTETGVSVMSIKPHHFDVGDILRQDKIPIEKDMKLPQLYDKLGKLGAECLVETLRNLPGNLKDAMPQPNQGVTYAPKVHANFARIRWSDMTSERVYNLSRAVEGFLALTTYWKNLQVKLHDIENEVICSHSNSDRPGFVFYDATLRSLKIVCANRTCISVKKVKVYNKKLMTALDFNNGYIMKEDVVELRCFH